MMNHRNDAAMTTGVMKKLRRGVAAGAVFLAALALFTGASIWEGEGAVSTGADFPESGYYVATNSFPRNTIVDVTNLATGKTVRAIVASGLDSPGLLAVLSRECAAAVGLQSRAIGRVRLVQPADPVALSGFGGRDFRSGDPDFDPEAALEAYGGAAAVVPRETPPPARNEGPKYDPLYDPPLYNPPLYSPPEESAAPVTAAAENEDDSEALSALSYEDDEENAGEQAAPPLAVYPESSGDAWFVPNTEYALRPAEERPPESSSWMPDSAYFIDPVDPNAGRRSEAAAPPPAPPAAAWTPEEPEDMFGAPLLSRLESGKYYVQLGAYSKTESVEKEVGKLKRNYPVAVQDAGTAGKPLYRVLVGPVNSGESGALLQRFRGGGYKDAFVRKGN
jgi:cell division septation protein DedD